MACRPFRDVGVKSFAVFDDRGEQRQVAARAKLRLQPALQLVTSLRFHRRLAIRAILNAKSCKQQADEMINLCDSRDRAFAAASAGALLNANRWRNARDQINVRSGQLLHELPGVNVHGVQEPPLAFGKNQIKGERAFSRTTNAGYDHKLPSRNAQREILKVVLPRAVDMDGLGCKV